MNTEKKLSNDELINNLLGKNIQQCPLEPILKNYSHRPGIIIINEQYGHGKSNRFSEWVAKYRASQQPIIIVAKLNKEDKSPAE
jgi:hypothetical protein